MDIERGNIEIVFQKIPYMYVIKSQNELVDYCSYNKIAQDIYMRYSSEVFLHTTDDERRNNYLFMCNQMKIHADWWKNDLNDNIGVFQLVFSLANKMLRLDGNEIKCKFEQLLRWREISLLMGQDFFTCAYLAFDDWKKDIILSILPGFQLLEVMIVDYIIFWNRELPKIIFILMALRKFLN